MQRNYWKRNMPTLHELQHDFAQAVLEHSVPSLAAHIHGPQKTARIQLYANTVYGTQSKALEAIYPVIARLLGQRCFDGLARHYIRQAPSRSGDLHDFGVAFIDLIAASPLATDYPYLTDVAQLEWQMHCVFHAKDEPALSLQCLQEVAPERYTQIRFQLAQASALLAMQYPAQHIWAANQPGCDGMVVLEPDPAYLLLRRTVSDIEMLPLSSGEYALLSALSTGAVLGEAIVCAIQVEPRFNLQNALAQAMTRGLFVGMQVDA